MKNYSKYPCPLLLTFFMLMGFWASARHQGMQYFRPNDKRGLNVFETTKDDTTSFHKLKVRVGGNFEQSYQMIRDKNTALPLLQPPFNGNVNSLTPLVNGFDLAMANLNIDAQLADGIRVQLVSYLASRHHEDTWAAGSLPEILC